MITGDGSDMEEKLKVDAAFCLSLRDAVDRRKVLDDQWAKIGIEVQYILSDRAPNPALDCSQTHQNIARMALERGYQRVLVFEDDVRFYDIPVGLIRRINLFMDADRSWDIFYLGGILGKLWLTRYRGIARIRCAGVQSYILHERAFKRAIQWDYTKDNRAVDTVYKRILKGFSCFPLITRQEEENLAPSSIAEQRRKEGNVQAANQPSAWKVTKRKQYWCAYFRYLHRWLFRLQQ